MIRKVSLEEFKKNVFLFPYLKKENKTTEQVNFALDEIEKQNSIYKSEKKIFLKNEGYNFVHFLFCNEIQEKEDLRKNVELALRGINYDEFFITAFDDIVKQDKRVLMALAERKDYRLRFCLSEEQKEDVELLKEIISRYPSIFLGLSTKLKENKELKVIYEKNKLSLNWLLNCIVKGLHEYMISFVLYFFILLFFKFNEKKEYIFYIFLGIIVIENMLKYFKCEKKKETMIKLITIISMALIFFLFILNKNFIDETRNFIIILKHSDFFPLNTLLLFIWGLIISFDGISVLMDKIRKILILLINRI